MNLQYYFLYVVIFQIENLLAGCGDAEDLENGNHVDHTDTNFSR